MQVSEGRAFQRENKFKGPSSRVRLEILYTGEKKDITKKEIQ